jgi:dihydrofolate reductase
MHTFLIVASSADGYLADKTDQKSTVWTSKEDAQFFNTRTKQAGLMVMGSTTYNTIGHPLKDRITIVLTNNPEKITDAKPLTNLPTYQPETNFPTSLYTTNLNPSELVDFLNKLNYPELAVCGGSSVYTQFAKSGQATTLYLTFEPHIFGSGIPLFTDNLNLPLTLKNTQKLNPNTILLEYTIQNSPII